MHLHFLVPDFLPSLQRIGNDLLQGLELRALEKLTARGTRIREPADSAEAWLFARYGFPAGTRPSAPYCLSAEGIVPGNHYWSHADPVHLGLQRTGMSVVDASQFSLEQNEADALVAALNSHFATDGLEFSAPVPHRWYVKSTRPLPAARPLAEARGDEAEQNPFPGDDGGWKRLLSEIQMLLHAHPVNAAREERNVLPINSLWLWGGGTLAAPAQKPFDAVFADSLLASGLHHAAGGQPLPLSTTPLPPIAGNALIEEESLSIPAAYGDFWAWREALANLESRWFTPLLHDLEQSKIAALTLHFPAPGSGLRLEVRRSDLWKAWRRKPLTRLIE